jgi:spore coat protein U-like protein
MKRILFAALACTLLAYRASANCTWTNAIANMNFGTYSVFSGSALTATSSFRLTCTVGDTGRVKLTTGGSGSYNPRKMARTTAPAANLNYNLYRDAANTMIWGDGTGGTQFLTFTATSGNTILNGFVYGTIPAGLDVPAGTYTDTIQVNLTSASGNDNSSFTVTAVVQSECTVSTVPLNFGAYDPVSANLGSPKDATANVNVYCTKNTVANAALDNGLWFSGGNRRLKATTDFLNYQAYRDAARSVIWNAVNINSGTSASKLTAIGGGFTAYGRIFLGQDVQVGSYTDTILVTVNY